jgi:hypothetical protein
MALVCVLLLLLLLCVILQDTPTVSNEDLTSILNTNTSVSPLDDAGASPMSDMSQLQPLIDVDRKKQVSLKNTSDSKNNSPKRPLSGTSSDTDRQLLTPEKDTRRSVTNDQDDVGFADDLTSTNPRAALLGKNATSNLSLDSYDKTKNPFFADA